MHQHVKNIIKGFCKKINDRSYPSWEYMSDFFFKSGKEFTVTLFALEMMLLAND